MQEEEVYTSAGNWRALQRRSLFSRVSKAARQGVAWGENGAMFDVPVRVCLGPLYAFDKIKGRE